MSTLSLRAALLSVAILTVFLAAWHAATQGGGAVADMDPEYARLMGAQVTQGASAMPGPSQVGMKLWEHLSNPFYDNGPNDKGLGIQLGYSIARVLLGYFLAVLVAIPFVDLNGFFQQPVQAICLTVVFHFPGMDFFHIENVVHNKHQPVTIAQGYRD